MTSSNFDGYDTIFTVLSITWRHFADFQNDLNRKNWSGFYMLALGIVQEETFFQYEIEDEPGMTHSDILQMIMEKIAPHITEMRLGRYFNFSAENLCLSDMRKLNMIQLDRVETSVSNSL